LNSLNLYLFINSSNSHLLNKLPKKTSLIYRNYSKINCKKEILEIKNICKKKKLKFYLSNNIKLAIQLKLDGVYIPSFNKSLNLNNFKHEQKKFYYIRFGS
jgi:thiamine-phosphate pyrophosphorylase